MYQFNFDDLPLQFKKDGKPVSLGTVFVAQTNKDAALLESAQRPYIRYSGNKDLLLKYIIYPYLMAKFPAIKWRDILGIKQGKQILVQVPGGECDSTMPADMVDNGVSDMATDTRTFSNKGVPLAPGFRQCNLDDYWGQTDTVVDVVKLQQMRLLPKFLDTIVEATLTRADDLLWQEGYNKKLGLCAGNYTDLIQARNLLIIDVSASIPRGVSGTMLALADTLREQMKADLIITGGCSRFWEYGSDLPDAQRLRDIIPLGNESCQFHEILKNKIFGHKWDNVVCFGDFDSPRNITTHDLVEIPSTSVGNLYSFRVTGKWDNCLSKDRLKEPVGYCKWVQQLGIQYEYDYDLDWVKDINQRG